MGDDLGAERWHAALASGQAVLEVGRDLRRDRDATLARLRISLRGPFDRAESFMLLACLGSEYVRELVDDLVLIALSPRDCLRARELLGILHHRDAARLVPGAVGALLAVQGDDDAHRRMAELLDHLGLEQALRELCARAAAGEDAETRTVAEGFG